MASRIRLTFRAAAAALLPAAAAGCLSSGTDVTGTNTSTLSAIRIVQGVSDAATGVDFLVNNTTQLTGMPLGVYVPTPSGYVGVAPNSTLGFAATGSTTPFYNQAPAALVAGQYSTVISYGRVAAGAAPAATAVLLADTTGVTGSPVLVRVFNAVDYITKGSGTAVDVYVYPQGAARPTTPTVPAVAYGTRSPYVTSTVGNLTVDVFAAGGASTGTPLFSTALPTGTGSVRTLVLLDPAAGTAATTGGVLVLADQN